MNISIHKTVAMIAAAGFLCLAESTNAQQTQSSIDTSKVYDLGEVIISASRFEESPETVGRNVTVITKDEIDGTIQTSVAGILAEQQSLHTVGDRQTPGSNQTAFLRNSNSNHYIVMIDGTRISDPSTNNNGVELSELSLAGVERIEIVRGSHSTLYGSSAIGGVINIITQGAGRTGINAGLNTQHGLLDGDTYATSNSASANFSSDDGLYANLSVYQQYTPGLDATVDTVSNPEAFNPQDQDHFQKLDLSGKIGYENSLLDIYGSYRRVDQNSATDQGAYTDDDNAQIYFRRNLFNYGGSFSLSDRVSLNFKGALSGLGRDFVNDSSVVDASGNYDGIYTETNGKGFLWENELTVAYSGDDLRLLAGANSNTQTMTSRTYTYASSFDFESTTDLDTLNLREVIKSGFIHADLNGSLLTDELESVSLILGSRIAHHNRFGTHLTYEINPKVQITPSALLYGSVSTGFNAPSLYQLHSPNQAFGAYSNRGNDSLNPETSVSYELGWKQSFKDLVQLNVSLFKTDVRNGIEYIYLWDGNTDVDNLGFEDYRGDTYINIGKQDINGIEVGTTAWLTPAMRIEGGLTYTRSTLTFSPENIDKEYTGGNHVQIFESGVFVDEEHKLEGLVRRPQLTGSLKAFVKATDNIRFSLSSRIIGARNDILYDSDYGPFGALGTSRLTGYNLTDVGLKYDISNSFSIIGEVKNLLILEYNNRFFLDRDFQARFTNDFSEIRGYNSIGRSLFLKASVAL